MQMTLYFIYPAITLVMAWLVYGEAATWVSGAGCAASLLGVAVIAQPPFLFGGGMHYNLNHWLGKWHGHQGLDMSRFSCAASLLCWFSPKKLPKIILKPPPASTLHAQCKFRL